MIQVDSRKIKKGDTFVAIKGFQTDGHNYALAAQENGAIKVICEHHIEELSIPQKIVPNPRQTAGELASQFFGNPTSKFKLIGITGTNGKTTTTYMVKSILESTGAKCGLIGTNHNMIGDKILQTERTTPESVDLQALFAQMADAHCQYVIMEVSSHALALDRTAGSTFEIGAFTNLTQDHLDFHKDFDDYFSAKAKLFEICKNAVINIENDWGKKLVNLTKSINIREVCASDVNFPLPPFVVGKFNLENAALARGICLSLGLTEQQIIEGFTHFKGVSGRMEAVHQGDFNIIIDYAHTPDGLENLLKTAREFTKSRLICLFGCGGDRDNKKRPIMGNIASNFADFCIVTSDNPRTENPTEIINQILAGMDNNCEKIIIENRHKAIEYAIKMANKGDTIILAGKGHEDYQIIGTQKHHFDEHEIVKEVLNQC